MQILLSDKLKKAILPGLFASYLVITIIAFLLHAQYFNSVLDQTFATPTFPSQVAVDLSALNRVALLINLDQSNINRLTASPVRKTTPLLDIQPTLPLVSPAIETQATTTASTATTETPRITTTTTAIKGSTTPTTSVRLRKP